MSSSVPLEAQRSRRRACRADGWPVAEPSPVSCPTVHAQQVGTGHDQQEASICPAAHAASTSSQRILHKAHRVGSRHPGGLASLHSQAQQ